MGECVVINVLFICSGNICRSPTAEGVFRSLVAEAGLAADIRVDSAGLGSWHAGEAPDRRAQAAARDRGFDLAGQRARQVTAADFDKFDFIIGMDRENRTGLMKLCPAGAEDRVHQFLDFVKGAEQAEIPDPYYGSGDGFARVLDLVEAASHGLLAHIRANRLST
jgi:protein-tyrosine phosphatase